MEYVFIFLKAFIVGFLISMPISPIGIICFRRFIQYGPRIGFFSGLGSATADFIVGIIAAIGLSFFMSIFDLHKQYVQLAGSMFFIALGIYILNNPPSKLNDTQPAKSILKAYASILFITLSNPAIIPSFTALLAGIGAGTINNVMHLILLAASISLGSITWWALLAIITTFVHKHIQHDTLKKINTLCGIIIFAFGIVTLLRMLHILW